jgi:hypothetical protein
MATTEGTQQPVCPYLPPEIWHRILLEHARDATRTDLWTCVRRVCSPWRSELAKLFAKKYFENVNLVQIEPDFGSSTLDCYGLHMQQLRATFNFNRYERNNKHRCVFTEILDSITKRDEAYDRKMFAAFEEKVKLYLGTTGQESARFDLPPYRIRVGPRVNDTELPNLQYDSQKREISFEWEGMFTRFFREAAALEKLESKVKDEAKRWLENDGSITGSARGLAKRHMAARRTTAKRIRRMRIKDSYLEHHGVDFKDDHFNEEEESSALERIERWQDGSFLANCTTDCTENPEEKLTAKSLADYWQSLRDIDFTPDTTDYGAIKVEGVFASTAIERLVHPRPGSDDYEDVMDYDTMVDILRGHSALRRALVR